MKNSIRCVVTEKNQNGKSFISEDKEIPIGQLGVFDFWATTQVPAPLHGENPLTGKPIRLEPPSGGTLFRLFEIPPIQKELSLDELEKQAQAAFSSVGASHCRVDTTLHPMMHTTRTIDYVVVLKGEVTLLLDENEVHLKPFDAIVQRGTNHYWINNGTEAALLLGVLVDAGE